MNYLDDLSAVINKIDNCLLNKEKSNKILNSLLNISNIFLKSNIDLGNAIIDLQESSENIFENIYTNLDELSLILHAFVDGTKKNEENIYNSMNNVNDAIEEALIDLKNISN